MSTTYIVTGRDTGHPLLDLAGTLNGLNIGDTFTTTLSGSLEAKLLGAGLIAHAPAPHSITSAGTPAVRKFPVAFDTPGLLPQGAPLYTPTVGEILLDAWVEIVTAWNGTTPLLDVGRFDPDLESWWGWFRSATGTAIDASTPDATQQLDFGILDQSGARSLAISGLAAAYAFFGATQVASPNLQSRGVPARFATPDPVRALVSRNGQDSGADPGATHGAAILYLITVTPV